MYKCLLIFLLFSFNLSAQTLTDLKALNGNELGLTNIDLSNSGLTEFPTDILKCKNLKSLNLSNNGLKDLPAELGKLKELVNLDLSENEDIDSDDLKNVFGTAEFELKNLNLSGCDLIAVPDEIALQTNIRTLNLSRNNLTSLPYGFISLGKLEHADFSNNYFYDLSWLLKYCWNLKSVDLSNNKSYKSGHTIVELSYRNSLNKLRLDNLSSFPINTDLPMEEIYLQNSYIGNFVIADASISVKRVTFDNCNFDTDNYSEDAAISQKFERITFLNIDEKYLKKMQFLKADTLVFRDCKMNKEMFDNLNPLISHIDLRSITLSLEDIEHIKTSNPSINFDFKEVVEEMKEINPPFENLIKLPEVKTISSENESVLSYKDVAVKVPKDAFMTSDGQPYIGTVNLSLKSYLNPTEVLLSGIPMTMNSNDETFMFSSGGMIDINGKGANGEQLELKKPLEVTLSSPNSNSDMALYGLNNDNNGDSWEEVGENSVIEPFKLDQRLVDSVANQDFSKMVQKSVIELMPRLVPVVTSDREDDKDGFKISFKTLTTNTALSARERTVPYQYLYYENTAIPYFDKYDFRYYGDSAKFYKKFIKAISDTCKSTYKKLYNGDNDSYSKFGPHYINDFVLQPNLEKDIFELIFSFKGRKVNLPVILTNRSGNLKKEIKLNSKFYRGYKKELHKTELRRAQALRKIVLLNSAQLRQREIDREKARQRLIYEREKRLKENASYMAAKATSSSVFRTFQVAQFGVFNCDVLARMLRPKKVADIANKIKTRFLMIIDFDKNGVIRFDEIGRAFFDAAAKTTILLFLSNNRLGILKWRDGASSEIKEMRLGTISNTELLEKLLK